MPTAISRRAGLLTLKALLVAFPKIELAAPTRRPISALRGLEMLLIAL